MLDNKSVHQIRKDTKQLRAHLHLLRQLEGKQKETERLRVSVKELARMLAGLRDTDVMSILLQELIIQTTDPELSDWMTGLQDGLKHRRLPKRDIRRIPKMVKEIKKSSNKLLSREPAENDINRLLETRLKILCEAGQNLLYAEPYDWEELHNWRKQIKQLMYQYKLKKNPTPRDLIICEHLEQLGDLIGKINDFTILENYARQQQNLNTRAHTLQAYANFHALLDSHKHALLIQARQLFAKLQIL